MPPTTQKDFVDNMIRSVNDRIKKINTSSIGILTYVDLTTMRCNVLLKHRPTDAQITLYDIPIAYQTYHGSSITVAPKQGDIVLILYTRNDARDMIAHREETRIGEWKLYDINNAVVIAGMYTQDDTPPPVGEDEILIHHKTGSEIRIDKHGHIRATYKDGIARIEINELGSINIASPTSIMMSAPLVTINGAIINVNTLSCDFNQVF